MKEIFKNHFNLPRDGFLSPIDLNDTEIGFSVYRESKDKDFMSLFRVFVDDVDYKISDPKKPLTITASYGKKEGDSIIVASSAFKKKINWPIDLISKGDFFYNISENKFYRKNKQIQAFDVLQYVYDSHVKPTRPLRGIWIRLKLIFFHSILTSIVSLVFSLLSLLQYFLSGEKNKIYHNLKEPQFYSGPSFRAPLNSNKSNPIDLFGYKVEPWIAGIYCGIHIIFYCIFVRINYSPRWLVNLFENNFLSLIYGIFSLGVANSLLPIILKPLNLRSVLMLIQSLYLRAAFKKIKI